MPQFPSFRRIVSPLRSRKVRVGIATVLAALAADHGLVASEQTILAIVGIGASLILGIAHEDAGRWSASSPRFPSSPGPVAEPPRSMPWRGSDTPR